jgi:Xaa-Pro dipeptidase
LIYNAVLRACNAVLGALKPGVSWKDMHLLANREMLHDLLEGSQPLIFLVSVPKM